MPTASSIAPAVVSIAASCVCPYDPADYHARPYIHAHDLGGSPASPGAASTELSSEAHALAGVLAESFALLAAVASASLSPVCHVDVARCTFALRGVYVCDVNVAYHLDAIQSPSACRTMTGTRQDVEPPQ